MLTRLDDRRGGSNTETNAYKIGQVKGRVNVEIFPLFVVGQSFREYLWYKNKCSGNVCSNCSSITGSACNSSNVGSWPIVCSP